MHARKTTTANLRLSQERMRSVVHAIAFGQDVPAGALAGAKALQRAHAPWWEARNVVGLCFAPKSRHGQLGDVSLQVLVQRKRAPEKIPPRRMVPAKVDLSSLGLPMHIDTDVREVGKGRLDMLVSADRPARPGFNIGHRLRGSGTLGCVVRSRDTGKRVGLSCAHVIARDGNAQVGERVLLPSLVEAHRNDITVAEARFGTVDAVASLTFRFEDARENVDAATVLPDDPDALDASIALLGVRPTGVVDSVDIGLPVRKVGAATERTFGQVQSTQVLASFEYVTPDDHIRKAWFADQIGITSFASPGDSGALVLDDQMRAVAMHIGSFDGMSVSMPIQRVLDAVRCDLF